MTTQTATKHTPRIVPGKDRYGHFLMIDDFRAAMPSAEVAQLLAAASELLESLAVMTSLCRLKYGNLDEDVYAEILKAEAAIRKATGE